MKRFIEFLRPAVVYAEDHLPSFTTITGFIFWTVVIYVFSLLATIVCGPWIFSVLH